MAQKNQINVIGMIALLGVLLLVLFSIEDRPIFFGALTSFTQAGNNIEFTSSMVENGTAEIKRTLVLEHGNVTSAHIDIFVTPSIVDLKVFLSDTKIYEQVDNQTMINVQRVDITSLLKKEVCNKCIIQFTFLSSKVGTVLVPEIDVVYGGNPNIENTVEVVTQQQPPVQQQQQTENEFMTVNTASSAMYSFILFGVVVLVLYLILEKGDKGIFKDI